MENTTLTREQLMELYSNYLLSNGKRPLNVYVFMKENNAAEEDFYAHFAGFESLEDEYLKHFFKKSLELTAGISGYADFIAREKLLNFYFVFIENLTLNRSLVLALLAGKKGLDALKRLDALRPSFKEFIRSIDFEQLPLMGDKVPGMVQHFSDKFREETLWMHFVSIIDFWKNDRSASFESTDVYIEKTIDTGFDMLYNSPLKKIVDVGKFIWKERFQTQA